MRGGDWRSEGVFHRVSLEKRVRLNHPLRAIRGIVNRALADLSPEFAALHAHIGRASIARPSASRMAHTTSSNRA